MIKQLKIAALAVGLMSAVTVVAAEERNAPVVVPIGSATLRVVEIGVPANRTDSANPCETRATASTAVVCEK